MGLIFNYMLHVVAFMTAFYLVYKWLMADTTFYRANRIILIAIYLLSWTLPLFSLSLVEFGGNSDVKPVTDVAIELGALQPVAVVADPVASTFEVWVRILIWIYLAGVVVFTFTSLSGCYQLWKIVRSGKSRKVGESVEIITPEAPGPFSWAGYVVPRPEDTGENYDLISAHERAHIRLGHWFDLVLAQVTLVLQWFSPAAWLMMRSLKINHEFEVDSLVAGDDPVRYQIMLIKMTVGARLPLLADSLNHSQLKKRLTMMMIKKSNSSRRFATFALPGVAALTLVVLSQPSVARVSKLLNSTQAWPEQTTLSDGKDSNSSAVVQNAAETATAPSIINTGVATDSPEAGEITSASAEEAPIEKAQEVAASSEGRELTTEDRTSDNPAVESEEIFFTPEKIAEYRGGISALMEFLCDNLKYPADLKEKQRVIVNFTINTDGSVTDVKVIRSGGEECDAEAMRALKLTSGNWTPGFNEGKPVKTKFTVPITFLPKPDLSSDKK